MLAARILHSACAIFRLRGQLWFAFEEGRGTVPLARILCVATAQAGLATGRAKTLGPQVIAATALANVPRMLVG